MRNFECVCKSIKLATDDEFLMFKIDQILKLSYLRAPELRINDWELLQNTVMESIFSENKNSENITKSDINVLSILTDRTITDMQRILALITN